MKTFLVGILAVWIVMPLFGAASTTVTRFKSIALGGTTNIVTDSGSALTYNGTPLGGGAALWSTFGGVLVPSPPVDLVNITSQLADGVTNVALVVDTAVPWLNHGAVAGPIGIVQRNDGTNVFSVRATDGAIIVGRGPPDGFYSSFGTTLASVRNSLNGDPMSSQIMMIAINDAGDGSYGDYNPFISSTESYLDLEQNNQTGLTHTFFELGLDSTPHLYLQDIQTPGTPMLFDFEPGVVSSGTAIGYLLNTKNALSAGDLLLTLQNSRTNKFTIDFAGAFTAGSTNAWKTGGENVISNVTNIMVTVNGTLYSVAATPR